MRSSQLQRSAIHELPSAGLAPSSSCLICTCWVLPSPSSQVAQLHAGGKLEWCAGVANADVFLMALLTVLQCRRCHSCCCLLLLSAVWFPSSLPPVDCCFIFLVCCCGCLLLFHFFSLLLWLFFSKFAVAVVAISPMLMPLWLLLLLPLPSPPVASWLLLFPYGFLICYCGRCTLANAAATAWFSRCPCCMLMWCCHHHCSCCLLLLLQSLLLPVDCYSLLLFCLLQSLLCCLYCCQCCSTFSSCCAMIFPMPLLLTAITAGWLLFLF